MCVENSSNDPKEHAHQADTDQKRLLSTESLDTGKDENGRSDNLDNTVDSTGE